MKTKDILIDPSANHAGQKITTATTRNGVNWYYFLSGRRGFVCSFSPNFRDYWVQDYIRAV